MTTIKGFYLLERLRGGVIRGIERFGRIINEDLFKRLLEFLLTHRIMNHQPVGFSKIDNLGEEVGVFLF